MINERWVGWITFSACCQEDSIITTHVTGVEGEGVRSTFWTAPERLTLGGCGVFRQAEQKLLDRIIVLVLEKRPRPNDTLVECQWLLGN